MYGNMDVYVLGSGYRYYIGRVHEAWDIEITLDESTSAGRSGRSGRWAGFRTSQMHQQRKEIGGSTLCLMYGNMDVYVLGSGYRYYIGRVHEAWGIEITLDESTSAGRSGRSGRWAGFCTSQRHQQRKEIGGSTLCLMYGDMDVYVLGSGHRYYIGRVHDAWDIDITLDESTSAGRSGRSGRWAGDPS